MRQFGAIVPIEVPGSRGRRREEMNRTHKYRGQTIKPCEFAIGEHRGRWAVRVPGKSGFLFADEYCAHYQSLAEAKAAIDEWTRTDHVS